MKTALLSLVSLLFVAVLPLAPARAADPPRRVFAVSGGYMAGGPSAPLINYVLTLSARPNPIVVYLGTARGDNLENIVAWYETMNQLPCHPRHLRIFGPTKTLPDFEKQLLDADIIYIAGGNTLNMLATWKAQGIDVILRKAWERGIVLTGESAGAVCWFEQTITDSRPGQLTPLDCLGWLNGSLCVHYNFEPMRKPTYHKLVGEGAIKDGIALEEGVGLLYEDDKLVKVLSTSPLMTAYQVRREGNSATVTPLKAELVTPPKP